MNKMNKMTTFYLVRHGQTEWNVADIVQGASDSPLTENGIKEIKKLAKELKKINFDLVFSSDLLRAKRTAEILALEHKLTIETNALIKERFFGHLEGKSNDEYRKWAKAFTDLTDKERFTAKITPDIESDEEIVSRFIQFLREIAIGNPGKTILTVSHGGIIKAFLIHLGYGSYKEIRTIKNGGFVKLESDGTDFFIKEAKGIVRYDQKSI